MIFSEKPVAIFQVHALVWLKRLTGLANADWHCRGTGLPLF